MSILDNYITEKPFPSRGASKALRERLLLSLMRHRPAVGEPFPSDAELSRHSGLSRMTVRKALDGLHREGWIDRRTGLGTFVGPRINAPLIAQSILGGKQSQSRIRMAVTIYDFGNLSNDWYTPHVLSGIDEIAEKHGVIVELLGDRDRDVAVIGRKLAASRPDVLAMIAPAPWNRSIVGLAQLGRIPVIATGTPLQPMGIPTVAEDGAQGIAIAVKHLIEHGHTRIGYVAKPDLSPWVHLRREGFVQAMQTAGLGEAEELIFWPSYNEVDGNGRRRHEQFDAYLQKRQPTAVVFASAGQPEVIQPLIEAGRLSIPKDLSVVGFDQDPRWPTFLGGVKATVVALPFREMGHRLGEMARAAIEGRQVQSSLVPCELITGESVLNLRSQN